MSEEFIAREGELHHCPGSRMFGVPPADIVPAPIAAFQAGRKAGEKRERAFWHSIGIEM
jgi:hypothetical protein